jgi:hypothetical protein
MARWAVLLYRMPSEPSAPRVAVWRALKRLPGGYVQDGAFAAPLTEETETQLRILAHDVRNQDGEATLFTTDSIDDERHLRQRLAKGAKA